MWHNVFGNREPVYRELCLEFYSTLIVKKELNKIKDIFEERCIQFYCGGVLRKVSVAQLGYYMGMYSEAELQNSDFRGLLRQGLYVKQSFDEESLTQYWSRITGGEVWRSGGTGNLSKIHSIRLRMLHRMIVSFLVQRSTHWEKVYLTDLWLIKLFSEGAPSKFALAPMVVLDRMWNHSDSMLVLGPFITMIYKRYGVFNTEECVTDLSPPVIQVEFEDAELVRAKIVKKQTATANSRLLDDVGVIPAPPERVEEAEDVEMGEAAGVEPQQARRFEHRSVPTRGASSSSFDFNPLQSLVDRMYADQQAFYTRMDGFREQVGADMTMMGSGLGRVVYDSSRYQPMWESQFRGQDYTPPADIPEYRPPSMFIPRQRVGGGFYFPPEHHVEETPRHDPGSLGPDMPVRFGSYTGTYAGMDVAQAGSSDQSFAEQVVGSFFDYGNIPGYQHYPPYPPPQ